MFVSSLNLHTASAGRHTGASLLPMVAAAQGSVYLGTGLWPLIHLQSFLAVTGPKTDIWLVCTVGVVVAVIGATLLLSVWTRRIGPETAILAVGSALGLAAIDVTYVSRGVIDPIYLADAVLEAAIAFLWAAGCRGRPFDARPADNPAGHP